MVDWDEDGDKDLLVGEYDGHIRYFENIGTVTAPNLRYVGYINCAGSPIDVTSLSIPVAHDYNEDGLKDLIVGNDPAYIRYYQNFGTNANPVFNNYIQIPTTPTITQIKNAPDIGDLNGDGLKDLAFGWWQGTVVYYPNSGTNNAPTFAESHELSVLGDSLDPGGWTHLEMNDWDEDGDLDLIYGEWNGDVRVYYNLSGEFTANITSIGPPIVIPPGGGSFQFNAAFANESEYAARVDVWTVVKLPNGNETGPLLQVTVDMPLGFSVQRIRTQNVPATAPAGNYEYILRMGVCPNEAWDESSFSFVKQSTGDVGVRVDNWNCQSWDMDETSAVESNVPSSAKLMHCSPNPFNPASIISFDLPESRQVSLKVYDIRGNEAAVLVEGFISAGSHEALFDASQLPSGVYFARLQSGETAQTIKMLLVK